MNEREKSLESRLLGTLSRKSTAEEIQKFIDEGVIITPSVIDRAIKAGANVHVIKILLDSLTIVPAYFEAFDLAAQRGDAKEVEGIIRCLVEHGVGFDCASGIEKNDKIYSKKVVELLWLAGLFPLSKAYTLCLPESYRNLLSRKGEKNNKSKYVVNNPADKLPFIQKPGFFGAVFFPIFVLMHYFILIVASFLSMLLSLLGEKMTGMK